MSDSAEFQTCGICDRSILRGERTSEYVDDDGARVEVCSLCKSRAEESGWVPADYAATVDRPAPESRTERAMATLRERLVRRPEPAPQTETEPRAPAEPAPPPPPPTPLEVFNASREPRKIAGLARSLGDPRVSVRETGRGAAQIVVAWDLSWYRFRVRGQRVSELAKGNEIAELSVADRAWNAHVADDGTLILD